MNKIRNIMRLGFTLCLAIAAMGVMGCAMTLETKVQKAGETDLNNIIASAARVRNPLGQEAIAIEIHAEAKTPPVAYRWETVIMNRGNGAAAPAAAAKYAAPATSPRGKKANIVVTPPAKQPPPAAPKTTTVVREEGYYPSTIPLANAGGVGTGFLQDWGGKALLGAGQALSGALAPGVNVVQKVVGGNATGGKATGGNAIAVQSQDQAQSQAQAQAQAQKQAQDQAQAQGQAQAQDQQL